MTLNQAEGYCEGRTEENIKVPKGKAYAYISSTNKLVIYEYLNAALSPFDERINKVGHLHFHVKLVNHEISIR